MLVDNDQRLAAAEAIRCWTAWAQGQLDEALAAGKRGIEAAERAPASLLAWLPHLAYGQALVSAGEHERGRAEILAGRRLRADGRPAHLPHLLVSSAGRASSARTATSSSPSEMTGRAEENAATMDLAMRTADAGMHVRACTGRAATSTSAAAPAGRRSSTTTAADTLLEVTEARLLAGEHPRRGRRRRRGERELSSPTRASERMGAAGFAQRAAAGYASSGTVEGPRARGARSPPTASTR